MTRSYTGTVDFDWPDRIVVTLPASAVQGIAHHPATKYMQMVEHHTAGDMTQKTSAIAPPSVTYTIDATSNHLTAVNGIGVSYDTAGAGNVTNDGTVQSTYDGFAMLHEKDVTGGTPEFYVYDANDERIAVIRGCVGQAAPNPPDCSAAMMTASLRDEQGKVLKQYEGCGNRVKASVMGVN